MFRLLFAGDEFWNAHGLSEAGVSFRELPKTFKSDVAWIWGTAPVWTLPYCMQFLIASGSTFKTSILPVFYLSVPQETWNEGHGYRTD